jgi:hypothetical protein
MLVGSFSSGWLISSFHLIGRFITSSYFDVPVFRARAKVKVFLKNLQANEGRIPKLSGGPVPACGK